MNKAFSRELFVDDDVAEGLDCERSAATSKPVEECAHDAFDYGGVAFKIY